MSNAGRPTSRSSPAQARPSSAPSAPGQLSARSPGQVHSVLTATTGWMFLNVRRRLFDSVRVPRAPNYATDRARIVDIEGGPEFASPTGQMMPEGLPFTSRTAPYTAFQADQRAGDCA